VVIDGEVVWHRDRCRNVFMAFDMMHNGDQVCERTL
jgi:hypothetical protein